MEERKSGINVGDIPDYIHEDTKRLIAIRKQPLAGFRCYPIDGEPEVLFEESVASERYRNIVNYYCNRENINPQLFNPGMEMFKFSMQAQKMLALEKPHYRELEKLGVSLIRQDFNLGEDEVEIVATITGMECGGGLPEDMKVRARKKPEFDPETEKWFVKWRLINSLVQGSAKKGHYMFHMAHETIERLMPNITSIYDSCMSFNDILYYIMSDEQFLNQIMSDG
jgi:hypothetical protein